MPTVLGACFKNHVHIHYQGRGHFTFPALRRLTFCQTPGVPAQPKNKQKRLAPAWALRCATGPLPPASLKRTTARNRSSSGSVSGGYASGRLINSSSRPGRLMGHTIKIKSQADQEQIKSRSRADQEQIKSRASGQRARARARAGYDVPISQNSAKNLFFVPGFAAKP